MATTRSDFELEIFRFGPPQGEALKQAAEIVQNAAPGVLVVLGANSQDAEPRAAAKRFAAKLAEAGVPAEYIDGAPLLPTEAHGRQHWPDLVRCEPRAAEKLGPLLRRQLVPVVCAALGSGQRGEDVLLAPGGADFAAAIFAASLGARSLTLFNDEDGLLTADRRFVAAARCIPELHYREAAELAYYGAQTLQPRALIPLMDRQIPLFIRSLSKPQGGTRIAADVTPGAYPVRALTTFQRQALVSVEGRGMVGVPGMAARTFAALAETGHSVSMISQASSESSICFAVPAAEAGHTRAALERAFEPELTRRLVDSIQVKPDVAIVAVVGMGMRGTPGIAARCFGALSREKINFAAIAQGSSELNITMVIDEENVGAALNALHAEFQLDRVRALGDAKGRESNLVLLGFGQIGRALAQQMSEQAGYFEHELSLNLKTIAVLDRAGLQLEESGFSPQSLLRLIKLKAEGRQSPAPLEQTPPRSLELLREQLWPLPLHKPVLADLTAAETGPIIHEALERGFHVVLANKKPLANSQDDFEALMQTAREHGLSLRYEATVGAGLPVLDTLSKLKEAGDRVELVSGCFSGTLGFLMTQLEEGARFSDAVSSAYRLGYTEPDPRDDLSGLDVARKALILARTLGQRTELKEISVSPLFRHELSDADPKRFIENLKRLDEEYAEKVRRAQAEGNVLRYVARISSSGISVGIEAVPKNSPVGRLHGTDNQIVLQTRRYSKNPLVITGPGAGADVTAAGVLNDVVAIAAGPARRRWRSARVAPRSL